MNFDTIMKETRVSKNFKKILMFDISHLFSRHIFSLAMRKSKEGLSNSEMYTVWKSAVINNVLTLIKKYKADEVIIAYDKKENDKYWRTKIFPDYKGQRAAIAASQVLINWAEFNPIKYAFQKDFIEAFTTLTHIEISGIEADDVIGILSKELNENNFITIITSDQDYKQLLKFKNVEIFDPIKRKNMVSFDWKKELTQKIIIGDSSDNIPNIKKGKAGQKTAVKISNIGINAWLDNSKFTDKEKEEILSQYKLNRELIDMDYIPSEVKIKVLDLYKNYETKKFNLKKLLVLTREHKLKAITEMILTDNISNILYKLN